MLTLEQMQDALNEIEANTPAEILEGLNGGIVLLPDIKLHPANINGDLFILGEYHVQPMGLGRYVNIYYGSFCRVHGGLSYEEQFKKLKSVVYHELFHHLESKAGEKSLEIQDAVDLEIYKSKYSEGKRADNKKDTP